MFFLIFYLMHHLVTPQINHVTHWRGPLPQVGNHYVQVENNK